MGGLFPASALVGSLTGSIRLHSATPLDLSTPQQTEQTPKGTCKHFFVTELLQQEQQSLSIMAQDWIEWIH